MKKHITRTLFLLAAFGASAVQAVDITADLMISIGVRETGGSGPAFSDAGAVGGIEWVNLDGQLLTTDGTWQQFSFTPSTDELTPFAGDGADGVLDVDWGSLEHIRIRNIDGIELPFRIWIDEFSNTDASGTTTEGFEQFALGEEVMFQEPGFSGSTDTNLVDGGLSAVTDSMAYVGTQSYQADLQFVDNDPTRWVRYTTFGAPNIPNAMFHVQDAAGPAPTISFWAKAQVIPEPSTVLLSCLGIGLLTGMRRR